MRSNVPMSGENHVKRQEQWKKKKSLWIYECGHGVLIDINHLATSKPWEILFTSNSACVSWRHYFHPQSTLLLESDAWMVLSIQLFYGCFDFALGGLTGHVYLVVNKVRKLKNVYLVVLNNVNLRFCSLLSFWLPFTSLSPFGVSRTSVVFV